MQGDVPPPPPAPQASDCLNILNATADLDFRQLYEQTIRDHDSVIDPYSDMVINSKFYDLNSLSQCLENVKSPVFLSINIQSLNSKYEELRQFITDLKVPKREIFDRSDFPDFYIIKSLCGGDFGVKIKKFFF